MDGAPDRPTPCAVLTREHQRVRLLHTVKAGDQSASRETGCLWSTLFVSVPVSVSVCACANASSASAYSVTVWESSTGVCVGTDNQHHKI